MGLPVALMAKHHKGPDWSQTDQLYVLLKDLELHYKFEART